MAVCLTDAQITAEISRYVTANHLPTGPNTEYFLFTPYNVGSCFDAGGSQCAYTAYCGYHCSSAPPRQHRDPLRQHAVGLQRDGCDANLAFGAGNPNADGDRLRGRRLESRGHETMTDPNLNAWYQGSSGSVPVMRTGTSAPTSTAPAAMARSRPVQQRSRLLQLHVAELGSVPHAGGVGSATAELLAQPDRHPADGVRSPRPRPARSRRPRSRRM